ncbi:MAG TPA: glycerol acyltransferase [Dysgonomonas sp.]|nr:glycerol acyltransferase [Dysgonomonas sp.]
MIKARHTYTGKLVCNFFSEYRLNGVFHSVNMYGDGGNKRLPVLMIANHFSWWDGFIQYRLNRKVFGKIFHVMMLEEQLSKNMILNKGGAFSIRKNSRDIIYTLNYCADLLEDKDNLVLIFPQGKIESIHTPYIQFEKGLDYLLKHLKNEVQLVFNINLVDYFSQKKPSLNIYYKTYSLSSPFDLADIERDFNIYLDECKSLQNR